MILELYHGGSAGIWQAENVDLWERCMCQNRVLTSGSHWSNKTQWGTGQFPSSGPEDRDQWERGPWATWGRVTLQEQTKMHIQAEDREAISVWPGSETPAWLSQEISCVWDFLWESPNCFAGLNIPHGAVGIAVDSQLHSAKQNQQFGKITALDALAGTTRTPSLLMARIEKKLAGAAEQEGLLVSAECGALLERKWDRTPWTCTS